ncbi:MAG: DUF1912 family protein [Streptococcaceae bacterium]|jgi:hypothetical protein|nr:DUF1912 family protein [Streptococcaceae bacterium]
MNFEQQFLGDLSEWLDLQVSLMAKAEKLAHDEGEHDAEIRYESRLEAYQHLRHKMELYKAGKGFHEETIV